MHQALCLCSSLPTIEARNRLCLVLHRNEARKTTNTGSLAARCLRDSEVLVHGRAGEEALSPWSRSGNEITRGLLLYPCDEAETLGPEHAAEGPLRLVVPDGNWRQASKMTRRIEWMAALPRVMLPESSATRYRLRFEPKAGGLATMEAIARAFGLLEGSEVQEQLEEVFRKMVDRTLYSRGLLAREEVYGGLPAGVMRHDPRAPHGPEESD
jgi:DTW domain-containing protein YfiP